ncbi:MULTISPECIES: hypothetical protein [unclassified Nostoc]|uniref:hypothetical protein n=1 Tax=unclassified Nostoc TaxID=2593658 RepID=UPI002AD4F764|nr:hypothetical protein [Nostoc sp. DedQUE03]MDZ7972165.1 hypothetical protein [Nostoc sp. DedQUE03]MDZ8047153.1 hypothetical protein [Nostoc sp. DedQUE02]
MARLLFVNEFTYKIIDLATCTEFRHNDKLSASLGGNRATCTEFQHNDKLSASLGDNRATCTEFRHFGYAQCIATR